MRGRTAAPHHRPTPNSTTEKRPDEQRGSSAAQRSLAVWCARREVPVTMRSDEPVTGDEVGVDDEWPATFAQVPDWITLHPELKAQSVREYAFLMAHVPMDGRRRVAFPGQASIARVLQLGRSDKVTPYTRALERVGAVRVEPVPTPKGRAYRYVLRFNPPRGYTGPKCLADFYGTSKDELDGRWAGFSMATAPVTPTAGGSPQKEGHPSPQKEGKGSPQKEGSKKTNRNQTNLNETAPSARSAADARRAGAGSSARDDSSGCAATTEPGPVADEVAEPEPAGPSTASAKGGGRTGGKGTRSPFPPEVRKGIYVTERLLPAGLRAVLAEQFPYGHLPNSNRKVIAQALETRTPDELGERAARRWISYGYERDHHDGLLRSPLGVVEELLRPTPYCPDPECEDGTNRHTTGPCTSCEARVGQRLADRRAGRTVPTQRPPRLYRHAEQCQVCDQPFREDAPEDLVCARCRSALDRAAAHATGNCPPEPAPEPDPAHCAAPPSDEYRRYRQQQAAAKTNANAYAGSPGPAPF